MGRQGQPPGAHVPRTPSQRRTGQTRQPACACVRLQPSGSVAYQNGHKDARSPDVHTVAKLLKPVPYQQPDDLASWRRAHRQAQARTQAKVSEGPGGVGGQKAAAAGCTPTGAWALTANPTSITWYATSLFRCPSKSCTRIARDTRRHGTLSRSLRDRLSH